MLRLGKIGKLSSRGAWMKNPPPPWTGNFVTSLKKYLITSNGKVFNVKTK